MATFADLIEVGIEVMTVTAPDMTQHSGRLYLWRLDDADPSLASEILLRKKEIGIDDSDRWLTDRLIERAEFTVSEANGESVVVLGKQALSSPEQITMDSFDRFVLQSFRSYIQTVGS